MTATIGTSTNTNNEGSKLSVFTVGSSTAVTLLPAQNTPTEVPRIKVDVSNRGNKGLSVRLYPAADDNIFRDIVVDPGETKTILEGSDIYTGEISGIMESGTAKDVHVTWF